MTDQQQLKTNQRNTGLLMMVTLAVQAALCFGGLAFWLLLLPAAALAVVVMVLTVRSASTLRFLRRKRALLTKTAFAFAAFVTLMVLLVTEPRNATLFWASALILIDVVFLVLGRLAGSLVGGHGAAPA